MHSLITVAVPTRHRWSKLSAFIESFMNTTNRLHRPHLLVMSDAPEPRDETIIQMDRLRRHHGHEAVEYNIQRTKGSLAELWNQCIIRSPTDWVLVCNDDGIFQDGWLEWLEQQIQTGKYAQINLMHYGAFCIHKSLLVINGWFDERFRGGGYEDNDWQLRLMEGGLRPVVYEWTIDWKYMKHAKVNDGNNWTDQNNGEWMVLKWARDSLIHWKSPSYRKQPEINWHPLQTAQYADKFKVAPRYSTINGWVNSGRPIYHWDVPVEQPKPILSTEEPNETKNNDGTATEDSGP